MVSNQICLVAPPYRVQVAGISFCIRAQPDVEQSLSELSLSASSGLDILHNEHRTAGVVHHIVTDAAQQDLLNA